MNNQEQTILERFEERAAIREYEGGQTRHQAEFGAYVDCRRLFGVRALPKALTDRHLAKYKVDKP